MRGAAARSIVIGDAGWLERLLLNLLDNAIKFTPGGGRIAVRVEPGRGGGGPRGARHRHRHGARTSCRTCSSGSYRADPARSPGAEGVGLGLSLVKWIADRHGATVSVDSRAGDGSRFSVRMPLHAPAVSELNQN